METIAVFAVRSWADAVVRKANVYEKLDAAYDAAEFAHTR